MNARKQLEECAAACRNAQTTIEEMEKQIRAYEPNNTIRRETYGMISAAIDAMRKSVIDLKFCANNLYESLDKY